jgi:hypothetical protein
MQCVDCHRNGADHMMVRGYEGEFDGPRCCRRGREAGSGYHDAHLRRLSLRLARAARGGRTPRRARYTAVCRRFIFDKLTCTACHSGPHADRTRRRWCKPRWPTSSACRGIRPIDAAAPTIQQPVFMRVNATGEFVDEEGRLDGKIAPHRMVGSVVLGAAWVRMRRSRRFRPIR